MIRLFTIMVKILTSVFGIMSITPIVFFLIGYGMGFFHPNIPRSNFYSYYWFMFPALLAPGIIFSLYYLFSKIYFRRTDK